MSFDCEAFIDGYIDCALWADCMPYIPEGANPDEFEHGGMELAEITPEARKAMAAECNKFIDANIDDLYIYTLEGLTEGYAGHDFWLTRCGHGVGYWSRGLMDLGERLSAAARAYGEPAIPYELEDGTVTVDMPDPEAVERIAKGL